MNNANDCRRAFAGYAYFGAHRIKDVIIFRVWSPEAASVYLLGDFCGWQEGVRMERIVGDVWECAISGKDIFDASKYKYKIVKEDGSETLISDPYATGAEEGGGLASMLCDTEAYVWRDKGWEAYREDYKKQLYKNPMNIYELCAQAWRLGNNGEPLAYRELASELAPYAKQLGATHVQLLPIFSHSGQEAWTRSVSSYFAPHTSGEHPCELMAFVDSMHEAGLGVILEVPLADVLEHFCKRYPASEQFGRAAFSFAEDVCAFWLDKYHADGLSIGGVLRLLEECEQSDDAQRALGELCNGLRQRYPHAILIGAESCKGACSVGFDLVLNTSLSKDIASYVETDPFFRKHGHEKITLWAANHASARSILSVPHTELTQKDGTLISRTYGDYWQRFAGVRALLGYLAACPGKNMCFMGSEIGQLEAWELGGELQWFLLDYDAHAKLQRYVSELGQLYLATPELWQGDGEADGFEWIDVNNREQSIVSFCRRDIDGNEIVAVVNFTPVAYENYRLGVKSRGDYREIFNSDDERFGGSGVINTELARSEARPWNWLENSIVIRIPPMAITMFKCVRRTQKTGASAYSNRKIIKF